MIRQNNKRFLRKFPTLSSLEEKDINKKPLRFYVEEVKEETQAWEYGLILAKQLEIPINEPHYYKVASKFIMTYMAFATADRKWLLK